jgi:hypothetical protein
MAFAERDRGAAYPQSFEARETSYTAALHYISSNFSGAFSSDLSGDLLIARGSNEFTEGFTPHHHRSKTSRVDILRHI